MAINNHAILMITGLIAAFAACSANALEYRCELENQLVVNSQNDVVEMKNGSDTMSFSIIDIDADSKTARLVANVGSANIYAFETGAGFNFVEITGGGSAHVLSVDRANKLTAPGNFGTARPATYSRQTHMFDGTITTFYVGKCMELS
ncbi:hypothetical protein [Roseibium alexandrii]|uniref:Uncharacterized protein n=1 Tax=Roseibium alexandrii (strain DSM 17067 / NCIMB 14079 / DFL-11) TaxID=244592 RepID=A0A5E8H2I1_ROSAD|nr:hypothetical protein [Roseibium alexandrii]EEE46047.1 hypothetical protein SADFL11_3336 [Roseibium alexandrii DFL-11]